MPRRRPRRMSEMDRKLNQAHRRISVLSHEIAKLEVDEGRERHSTWIPEICDRTIERLEEFPPDKEVFIEEFGIGEELCADLYVAGSDGPSQLQTIRAGEKDRLTGFLEDRMELSETHEHGYGAEHRVWKIKKRELKVMRELIRGPIEPAFERGDWNEIREKIEELREAAENPLQIDGETLRALGIETHSEVRNLRRSVMKYAIEHDLKIPEATTALSIEDDDFAELHNRLKGKLKDKVEEWERIFDPYIPPDSNQKSREAEAIK